MHKICNFDSSESGFGDQGSAIEEFFNKFVPHLDSLARDTDELLEDPTIELDAMAVCKPPPQKKICQKKQAQYQPQQSKIIMKESSVNSSDLGSSGSSISGRDLSMDEINLIVGQLRGGGPYSEKLAVIMLKGLEKTLTDILYRMFLETGLPDNWFPIVKMNNDNTPYVEFLIKSDLSDQDPLSQLNDYSADYMALCKYVLNQLRQNATRHQSQLKSSPANANRCLTAHHHNQQKAIQHKQIEAPSHQQPKASQPPLASIQQPQKQASQHQHQHQHQQKHQSQQQQQQQQPRSKPIPKPQTRLSLVEPQKHPNLEQKAHSFGAPFCSTPKSKGQRILPPRACKSAIQKY